MSSSVFFRFKSQREPSRVTFDGTGISVFELKRDIIAQNKLGDGTDFELIISSEDADEEYDDDTVIIPRSTTVIVKRLPAAKAGRGGAARYISGKMPQNAKNAHRQESSVPKPSRAATSDRLTTMNGAQSEDDKIAAMLQLGAEDWVQQQQQMANAAPVYRPNAARGKAQNVPDHPPPPGYVCYRCGEKGHWIQVCPTNDDPKFDNRTRIKRTTGIPKSFLTTVDKPAAVGKDETLNENQQPTGVMVNSEGEWVIAKPDQAAWERYQTQAKVSAAAQSAAAQGDKEVQDRGLECPIDKRLFVDPVKTPCCDVTYCHECIQSALLDNDLRCPHCATENVPIDDLVTNGEMATKVAQFEKEKAESVTQSSKRIINPAKEAPTRSAPLHDKSPAKGSLPVSASSPQIRPSKKRPADSDLENERLPQGPTEAAPGSKQQKSSLSQHASSEASLFNPMGFPLMNGGVMGMGALPSINMATQNPMMPLGSFMGNDWNNMWNMGYQTQSMNPTGSTYGQAPLYSGGLAPQDLQHQTTTGYNGMHRMGGSGMSNGRNFANQQRSNNEEESAYFRKPVNPNRQSNRRNWNHNRPADYREI